MTDAQKNKDAPAYYIDTNRPRKRPLSSEEASEWLAGYRRAVASHDAEIAIENQKSSESQFVNKELGMQVDVEWITPKQAEKYLQSNTSNRNIRRALVSQYARDIANGNWKLTHQGIAFDCHGTLLDGQHRLEAIIESGLAVQMLVARGIESKHQLQMDDHAKRNAGDALTLIRGEAVTTKDVAIIRAAVELQHHNYSVRKTKTELNGLLNEFRAALDFTNEFLSHYDKGVSVAPVWGAIALSWFYVEDVERLRLFCRILCGIDMTNDERNRSAVILREMLLRNNNNRGAAYRMELFRKAQRAIVAFIRREKIKMLKAIPKSNYYAWPLVNPVRTRA